MSLAFQVQQIDHVEVFVPDRYQAAGWYERVLGLRIVPACEHWAEHPQGPLMISSDGGSTMLALFTGEPRGTRDTAGHHRVAFRVDGRAFLTFLAHARDGFVYDDQLRPLPRLQPVDHGSAYSVYFCDPYGNRFEVTTYETGAVSAHLETPAP